MITSIFSNWSFDLKSSIITLIIAPAALFAAAILKGYIKRWISYILEGLLYWISRSFKRSLASALTLKRYCRLRLAEDNQFLFVPSSQDFKLEIDKVFVTLSLDQQNGDPKIYNHRNLLDSGNRIRVIGDPGSGKSSLIKRIFRDTCYLALEAPKKAKIPFIIELKSLKIPTKKLDENLGDWFLEKIIDDACKNSVYQMRECFDTYAEGAGILILLDGLDEVSSSEYPRVQKAINALSVRLAQMSERNTLVLTMRIQFHQQVKNAFRENFGHSFSLKPFTPSDIYEFLTQWPFHSKRSSNITRIYGDLTDRPTLREMCSNPLVLAMYVAEDQSAGHLVAPESRTEFYKKVTDELIIQRRMQQLGPTAAHATLREQRERLLGKVSYEHMMDETQSANTLNWKNLIEAIQETLKKNHEEAASIFKEISKETGIISEERERQSFRFIHLTFCEYLAAFEATQGQKDGWNLLISKHRQWLQNSNQPHLRSRLLEVIAFACGLLPRRDRDGALTDIASLNDDALLARCFLETKNYQHPCWAEFVSRRKAKFLATEENKWDDRWLRDLHLFNVVVKDAKQCSTHIPTANADLDLDTFFSTLAGNQKQSLYKLISAYAAQDAAAAFRLAETCNINLVQDFPELVIAHCDQPPFLALVLEKTLRNTNQTESWAALLAESGLRSRAVAAALSTHAPSRELTDAISRIPEQQRWIQKRICNYGLYTQLITVALKSPYVANNTTPCLKIISEVKAPGSNSNFIKRTKLLNLIALVLAACILIPSLFTKNETRQLSIIVASLGFYFSTTISALSSLKERFYRILLFNDPNNPLDINTKNKYIIEFINQAMKIPIFSGMKVCEIERIIKQMNEIRQPREISSKVE